MNVIPEQQWGQVNIYKWEDLTPHQWECFRLALMKGEAQLTAQGVKIIQSSAAYEVLADMKAQGVRVEHSPVIMQTNTQMITSIVVSRRDYKTDMLKTLPLYERKSEVFHNILTADDREFRNLEQRLDIAERNIFIDTAIESLPISERDLGIKPIKSLSYDQRREQVSSRYRASFDQTTEDTIKSVALAYNNGEVDVNKTIIPGVYEIKFVGSKGVPNNIEALKEALDIMIPAHLELTYSFIFNAWEFWRNSTWGECASKTWDDLRNWNEVR